MRVISTVAVQVLTSILVYVKFHPVYVTESRAVHFTTSWYNTKTLGGTVVSRSVVRLNNVQIGLTSSTSPRTTGIEVHSRIVSLP